MPERPVVLRVAGPTATLAVDDGVTEAMITPRLEGGPLVVGDVVEVRRADADMVIIAITPRRTLLERASGPDGPRRAIVANADVILVVDALTTPEPRPHLIDRYLVAAEVGGLDAAVILTKADTVGSPAVASGLSALYRGIGYPVVSGNAKDGDFVAEVRELIGDRVAALVGQSGVGKSTLTRGLTGVAREVGDVSARAGTGRHTTSDPRLIPMPDGGAVVDTAGVRTLFLPKLDPLDLADAFPEIRAVQGKCRFRDCRHLGEDGCALPGHIASTREESYRLLQQDA